MTNAYKLEYDEWLRSQIECLQRSDWNHLDVPHLIEELEALVRGEKSAVESLAYQIILHLLLIEFWTEESLWNRRHWMSEVENFRFQLNNKLTANLKAHLSDRLDFIYSKAKKAAVLKTGLEDRFPEWNVWGLSRILGDE